MTEGEKIFNNIIKDEGLVVTFKHNDETRTFKTFHQFKKFVDDNSEFWQPFDKGQLNAVKNNYAQLSQWVTEISNLKAENQIKNIIGNINTQTNKYIHFISSNSEVATFLVRLYRIKHQIADSAYHIIFHNNVINVNDKDHLLGAIEALQFLKSEWFLAEEKKAEIRYDGIVAKHQTEIEKIRNEYDTLQEKYKIELASLIVNINRSKDIFNDQTSKQAENFENKLQEWKDKITALEKAYDDLLLLKKPADYWKALQSEYHKKGKKWFIGSLIGGVIFIAFLFLLFMTFPEWLKGDFKIDHLKGVIILTIIVSVFSYLIHLFVKLSTSAFHLSRDAEERRLLTFLYLSLLKEGAIQPSERDIILQALFSRADTGLLKTDGTPTMPGNLADRIFSKYT